MALRKERDTVLRINSGQGLGKNTVPIEKFEFILNQLNEDSNNYKNLLNKFESTKKENDSLKQEIENKNKLDNSKSPNKNVSIIEKEFLSKFMGNDEEIKDFLDKDNKNNNIPENKSEQIRKNTSIISEKQNAQNSFIANAHNKDNNINERKMSQGSIKSKQIPTTQGVRFTKFRMNQLGTIF